jgi:pyruvate/2-oxoglutarate dehydrogenase complex dihydrolipoamide acyltransferase (E2) component
VVSVVQALTGGIPVFRPGAGRREAVVDDRVVVRDVLGLTVTIDHNVVDGAPATRFGAELRRILETAAAFGDHPRQET